LLLYLSSLPLTHLSLSFCNRFVDPALMESLEQAQCGNMYFAFRWLLIFLKREFSIPDIVQLWEVMWSGHLTRKYHLFLCLAIIEENRLNLMDKDFDHMLQVS
jgi:hypothetical protein